MDNAKPELTPELIDAVLAELVTLAEWSAEVGLNILTVRTWIPTGRYGETPQPKTTGRADRYLRSELNEYKAAHPELGRGRGRHWDETLGRAAREKAAAAGIELDAE